MNAFLLRDIPPAIAAHARAVAKQERCAINEALLKLLQGALDHAMVAVRAVPQANRLSPPELPQACAEPEQAGDDASLEQAEARTMREALLAAQQIP